MATYPGGIYSPTALTDGVDSVLASHQNTPNQELVAIETELGTNPKTITEATSPAASPASVAEFLDMVATAIKAFKGTAAHWYTALTGTPSATTFLCGDGSWKAPNNISPQQGFLLNGKLVPSVASNNLTLALKTLSGGNPSASDPVYIRIGDTVQTITAALSVTKNAGTNWFNAGAAELATQEIDYFAYLGYNATDGVVIGFARIPFARRYNDFNTTSTNEKYCAISTITNAAATDYYELVGRFAATLSAGAGYTWTVPTYTATNLVQRPIYETRNMTWVPTVTSGTGTPTTVTKTAVYMFEGSRIFLRGNMLVSNKGTAGGAMKLTPPFTLPDTVGYGQEVAITGVGAAVVSISNLIYITKYDAASPWTDTWNWYFQFNTGGL